MDKNYLIQKWLENDLTAEELDAFNALDDSAFLKEIIQEGKRFKGQNPTRVLDFENLEKEIFKHKKKTFNWTKVITKFAAVFVLSFGLYFLFDKDQQNSFTTQIAQTEQVILPDNSVVRLNELSQINYNNKNWNKERSIKLSGEAYFKVAKGKRFDVNTKFGTVRVLGTKFNVTARDSIFSVICYEGLVQVNYNNKTTKLPAGKAFRIINGKPEDFTVVVVQPEWLQNMKVFEQAKIGDVFAAIESHYKIQIIADDIDGSILFTGAFELDNLDNALKAATQTLKLTYEMQNAKVAIIRNAKQ